MHLATNKYLCHEGEVFAATLLLHHPILLTIDHPQILYVCLKGDYDQYGHGGEMYSKNIPVICSDQSRPGKRAKAVLVANTVSPTLTIGTAVSGKYMSTLEPKRIKP